ncbi:glycosyltransferase family 59 protein [Sporormia fimetaria CBS 119925]|uniref:Dol-P-Glc:Glc(2)Man(9)GlcNAc(2)-PP-Dol alpha-1,2-glucosyltransferase n=1 Tax=Sporormia fimetaria CBS 119925 TaxID=1340428 RepID=A0A6A6V6T6_9PLEO|nr:glycosyltransferase family 59 protein [Sporormia fimetaria CBS 119925]
MPPLLKAWAVPICLLAITNISATWYRYVTENVPEPYLDEVFHVPQAQRFCEGNYNWDPKITTPPGLYFASLLLQPIGGCDISTLRALNVGALCFICLVSYEILRKIRARGPQQPPTPDPYGQRIDPTVALDAHKALNIALFPPLFFFSALYYTDVPSTLYVLLNYSALLKREEWVRSSIDDLRIVILSIAALLIRQTNIFWVAIFPACLEVARNAPTRSANTENRPDVVTNAWNYGVVYDPEVEDATFADYFLHPISIAVTFLRCRGLRLRAIRATRPYVILLTLFTAFVIWNGGVVLGDKSNHIATLHTPQMLYIWPYITFFSLPLLLPILLSPFLNLLPTSRLKSRLQRILTGNHAPPTPPTLLPTLLFLTLSTLAVHYNTLIHPFTLADNRHYIFYIFRLLFRHPLLPYLAVPIYFLCAWACLSALTYPSPNAKRNGYEENRISFTVFWFLASAMTLITAPLVEPRYFIIPWVVWRLHVSDFVPSREGRQRGKLEKMAKMAKEWAKLQKERAWVEENERGGVADSGVAQRESAASCRASGEESDEDEDSGSELDGVRHTGETYVDSSDEEEDEGENVSHDPRLWWETAWYLLINAVTGWVFLNKGFEWASEPGKVQRFMW